MGSRNPSPESPDPGVRTVCGGDSLEGGVQPLSGVWASLCPDSGRLGSSLLFFQGKMTVWKTPLAHLSLQPPPFQVYHSQLLKASGLPPCLSPLNPELTPLTLVNCSVSGSLVEVSSLAQPGPRPPGEGPNPSLPSGPSPIPFSGL